MTRWSHSVSAVSIAGNTLARQHPPARKPGEAGSALTPGPAIGRRLIEEILAEEGGVASPANAISAMQQRTGRLSECAGCWPRRPAGGHAALRQRCAKTKADPRRCACNTATRPGSDQFGLTAAAALSPR